MIEANAYVPAVPQLKKAAEQARRIGLGVMGLGDLMYHCGIRYGSEEGQEFAAQVMEFIRYHAMLTSINLAEKRGAFPAIKGSIYDPEQMTWVPPKPITPYTRDFNRPKVDWEKVVQGIKTHGIRNAAQTTIAPTGTIATVAGCEGYGCEPVFALAYIRHVNDNGHDLPLMYTSPQFENALVEAGIDEQTRRSIIEQVMESGTCQGIEAVPESIQHVFVVSQDITAEEHVRTQAAMQAFVDNSLSKTVNFPADATEEDVATAYMLAWKLGCKGITVYVTGSRQKVVLETKATSREKEAVPHNGNRAGCQFRLSMMMKRNIAGRCPKNLVHGRLRGYTYSISTPVGKAFVTINENGGDHPFEVFVSTAKAGSETAAVSEAIGRLISYLLAYWLHLSCHVSGLRRSSNSCLVLGVGVRWDLVPTGCAHCQMVLPKPWQNILKIRRNIKKLLRMVKAVDMENTRYVHRISRKNNLTQCNQLFRSVTCARNVVRQQLLMKKVAESVMLAVILNVNLVIENIQGTDSVPCFC